MNDILEDRLQDCFRISKGIQKRSKYIYQIFSNAQHFKPYYYDIIEILIVFSNEYLKLLCVEDRKKLANTENKLCINDR